MQPTMFLNCFILVKSLTIAISDGCVKDSCSSDGVECTSVVFFCGCVRVVCLLFTF